MKIKVGEYVRTIDGYIRKVTQVNEKGTYQARAFGKYETDVDYKNSKCISEKKITKHSPNIIDLIEVGDVIKYKELFETKANEPNILNLRSQKEVDNFKKCVEDKEIVFISVVTHEQFKGMEYKV